MRAETVGYVASCVCRQQAVGPCMRRAVANDECTHTSPWGVVFYADEIGGHQLQHDSRNIECCDWSRMQVGCDVLSQEDAWFIICAMSADLVEDLPSNAQPCAPALKYAVVHINGHDIANCIFIAIWGESGPQRPLFAKLGAIVADEKAINELSPQKSANALTFCDCC